MNNYLYIFGYQTPEEKEAAAKDDQREEHTMAVFIEAKTEEQALIWGREISEEFTRRLFQDRNACWKDLKLAHCILDQSLLECGSDHLRRIPVVPCGKYPDFSAFELNEVKE